MGVCPVGNGEPGTRISAPVSESIRNDETVLLFRLLANKNVPAGSTASPNGLSITANGDPGAGLSAPLVLLITNTEMLPSFSLPTKTNLPAGSTAIPRG